MNKYYVEIEERIIYRNIKPIEAKDRFQAKYKASKMFGNGENYDEWDEQVEICYIDEVQE